MKRLILIISILLTIPCITFCDWIPYQEAVNELKIDFEMDHVEYSKEGKYLLYEHEFSPDDYCFGQGYPFDEVDSRLKSTQYYGTYHNDVKFVYEVSVSELSNIDFFW